MHVSYVLLGKWEVQRKNDPKLRQTDAQKDVLLSSSCGFFA